MSFLGEIRRRKVFQVAAVYAVVAWLLVQIVATIEEPLGLPTWFDTGIIVLLGVGFPVTLVMSWAFNLTSSGVVRDTGAAAATPAGGRSIEHVLIGLLIVAVGFLLIDNYLLERAASPGGTTVEVAMDTGARETGEQPDGEVVGRDLRSIAVLPFRNRSARQEDEFFVDGIHDDIIAQLFRIGGLKVISRTSVMGYQDTDKTMPEIGEELDVATVLEGGVQRSGNRVRINVQLIDAQRDEHLWTEIYNRELSAENIFDIQSEMAIAIADALDAALSPEDLERLGGQPTQSTRAYNFYLSGNSYLRRPELDSISLAVEQYQRAIEEDPNFALAWTGLSRAHAEMYLWRIDRTESRAAMALQAVQQAFALDPDLPEAHLAMAIYHYRVNLDYAQALEELAIAEQGLPSESFIPLTRSLIYRRMNRWEESVASVEQAIALDPRAFDFMSQTAVTLRMMRQYERAAAYYDRALDIVPDDAVAYTGKLEIPLMRDGNPEPAGTAAENPPIDLEGNRQYLGWISAFYERDYETALRYLEDWDEDVYDRRPRSLYLAVTHQIAGQPEAAEHHFRQARVDIEAMLAQNPDAPPFLVELGIAMAGLGQAAEALATARRGIALQPTTLDAFLGAMIHREAILGVFIPLLEPEDAIEELDAYLRGAGAWSIEGLLPDPRLDVIRDHPGFQELVERYLRR